MLILHTSDWHVGRSLHGADLGPAFDAFGQWLVNLVRERGIDAVLISGDLFDRALPPVDALQRVSRLLEELCELCTVVLTPGNHDSATRLGFAAGLLGSRLHIVSRVADIGRAVEVFPGGDPAAIEPGALVYPMPYLEPDLVRRELSPGVDAGDEDGDQGLVGRSHEAVIGAALARIDADLERRRATGDNRPALCMVHAFITGAAPSDSERDIGVGGVNSVPAGLFDLPNSLVYVAAGHLHRPQDISGGTVRIRYSGSPLHYSFSEAGTEKSVTLVHLGSSHETPTRSNVEIVPIPTYRPLSVLRGTMDKLLSTTCHEQRAHYLSIAVTDCHRPEEMVPRLRAHFPHALVITHSPEDITGSASATHVDVRSRHASDVLEDFFADVGGRELTESEQRVVADVVTELRGKAVS